MILHIQLRRLGLYQYSSFSVPEKRILERYGFQFSFVMPCGGRDVRYYWLDTSQRMPLTSHPNTHKRLAQIIESGAIELLRDLGIPDSEMLPLFSPMVSLNGRLSAASVTFGEKYPLTLAEAEKTLSYYFEDSFVYSDSSHKMPTIPLEVEMRMGDIKQTVLNVQPDIFGPRKRLALDGQKVYSNNSAAATQLAVVRPFTGEGDQNMCTLSLYEIRNP